MLSVQSPGYAGMERLGVPARAQLVSPSEDSHLSRLMRMDALQAQVRKNHQYHHHQTHGNNIRCPHHVSLPDSEWGQDRDLQIRASYQQAEITRSYIKAPPNKTALDVPEYSDNNIFPTTSACTLNQQGSSSVKSKNAIVKFFSRISSPKSPADNNSSLSRGTSPTTTLASSSSSSSSSSAWSSTSLHKSGYNSDISTNHSLSSATINTYSSASSSMSSSTASLNQLSNSVTATTIVSGSGEMNCAVTSNATIPSTDNSNNGAQI